jgi:hypothetical protein
VRWTFTLLGHPGEALTETLDNRIIELPISGLLTVERKNDKGDYLQGWSLYLHASYIMDFLIPIPMFLSHYIFSEKFFTAWVVISFIWVFSSAIISVVLPIWETRGFFRQLFTEIMADLRGRKQVS